MPKRKPEHSAGVTAANQPARGKLDPKRPFRLGIVGGGPQQQFATAAELLGAASAAIEHARAEHAHIILTLPADA